MTAMSEFDVSGRQPEQSGTVEIPAYWSNSAREIAAQVSAENLARPLDSAVDTSEASNRSTGPNVEEESEKK